MSVSSALLSAASKLLIAAVLVTAATPAVAQRDAFWPVVDGFGYLAYDQSSPTCTAAFTDISATGAVVGLTASGAEPALDDGGAVIALAAPFELYGVELTSLVVSSNGYLAGAGALSVESGGDFANDCPLPAIPQEGPAAPLRIAVLHDDLDGSALAGPGTEGAVRSQFFPVCPRPSDGVGAESCTIIQWSGWRVLGGSATFDLQAVLYHQSFEVAVQYSGAPYVARGHAVDPQGATIGLQDAAAARGLAAACDLDALLMDGTAFCFFNPGFPPPFGDLAVALDEKTDLVAPGGQLDYFLTVVNPGPGAADGVGVTLTLPGEIAGCTWTCTAGPGSSCAAAGTAPPFGEAVDLGAPGVAFFELACALDPSAAGGSATVAASVSAPSSFIDPDLDNNQAVATTEIPIPVLLQRFTVESRSPSGACPHDRGGAE